MKLFLFPKGTFFTIIAIVLTLCQFSVFGNNLHSPQSGNLAPFGLKSVVLSDTSANLSWSSFNFPRETQWDLELVLKGTPFSGTPTHLGITTGLGTANPFFINNLVQGTNYEYRVRAICGGVPTAWSNETHDFFTHVLNGSGCGIDLEIPDVSCNNPIRYPIQVRNEQDTILGSDVVLQEIRLIIEHDWLIDLELWLESPTGARVRLIDENGGSNDNFGNPSDSTCTQFMSLLNDNACNEQSILGALPPFTGRYFPLGNLNAFNDNSNPNGIWDLIICDDAAPNIGSLKFVELIFEPVTCTRPTGLVATAIDSNSVTLDWFPGGFCDSTVFEYGPPGFTPGSAAGTQVSGTCPPFNLTGLTPDSDFDIYILENCGGGNSAAACKNITVTTSCSPPPLTISADFDNLPSCGGIFCLNPCDIDNYFWHNARNDVLEWTVFQNGTSSPGTGPSADVSGSGQYIYMEVNSLGGIFGLGFCRPGDEGILLSNCMTIDTRNTDTCHVSFNYHMFGNAIGELKFEITTDGINWTTLWSQTGAQGDQWNEVKLSLLPYDGINAQFRFVGVRGNGSLGDIGIDEINFFGSTENSSPPFTFFIDNDGDGFGGQSPTIQSCFNNIPPGYIDNDSDCNDFNPTVSSSSPEIPCNNIDENCNGNADDKFLPPPVITGPTSVCEGETFDLTATPGFGGGIFWSDNNFNSFIGDTITINGLVAINGQPTTYQYTAFEEFFRCFSPVPDTFNITVNPVPNISTQEQPVICQGEVFDLSTLQIIDQNNTAEQSLTFHTGFPTNSSNILSSTLVSPNATQNYYIRKIAEGLCEDTTMVTITVLLSPVANIAPIQDTFETCKGIPAFLTALPSGGVPGQSIDHLWNTFETTSMIRVNSGATNGDLNLITYTAIGQNQCTDTDTIIIKTVSSVDTIQSPIITPVSTCFGSDGSIQVVPIDGVPSYMYMWSGPSPGSFSTSGGYTIPNLQQGTYSITISDSSSEECDFVLNNLVVNGPSASVVLDDVQPATCYGANDGGISLSVSGTNPTIAWSSGITSTSDDVTGLAAGFYNVTVTDSGCQTILSNIVVPQPDSVSALFTTEDVDCFGGNDGQINLSVSGGNPNYSFVWNNAPPVQNPSGLTSGDYYYTITDSQGCTFESDTITITEPPVLSVLINQKQEPLCFGDATGAIDVSAMGGTPPYQYFWSDGVGGSSRSGLPAGPYDVTVLDANDCQIVESTIMINNPPLFTVDAVQVTDASCFGIADGAIDMTASGGTGTIGYLWNTNDATQDLTGLANGDYVLTVIDGNSCRAVSDTIEILAPNNLNIDLDTISPSCIGRSDGAIDLEVLSGGTSPYTYLWSDSTTNEDLTNVPAGFYHVTITHADGCISTFTKIEVDADQVIDGSNVESLSPICFGDSTGRILSFILGGQTPYNYNWNNGMSTENLENLSSGFYELTVTDANDCRLEIDSIEITENDSLMVQVLAVDPVLCHNDTTGSITVQGFGGTPNYTYIWNGGTYLGANITGLPPGSYDLTLQDSVDCIFDNLPPVVIDNPPLIDVSVEISLDPDCSGGLSRDSIKLTVSGGVGNLNFLWSDSTTGANLVNIPPGEYAVTVSDENNCEVVIEEIKVPTIASSFYFDNIEKEDVSCFDMEDGSIEVSFAGGVPPYQFSWSDGAGGNINNGAGSTDSTTVRLFDEEEGVYILTVVDSRGCVIESQPIEIIEPQPISIEIMNFKDVICFGGSSGEITSNVFGGNPPYNFAWVDTNTGDSIIFTKSAASFPAGSYILRVEDNIGCTNELTGAITINEPDPFLIDSVVIDHVNCFGDSTGSVEFEIIGGTLPVGAFWGDLDPLNLPAGTHSVTVRDANNCLITPFPTFTINEPTSGMMFTNDTSKNPICHDDSNGEISFSVSGGSQPYQFFINNFPLNDSIATGLSADEYNILVIDNNQCQITKGVTLINPPEIEVEIIEKPVTVDIWNDGELTANVTGGVAGYQYLWSNDSTTQTITGLSAGGYHLTVTDIGGCSIELFTELDFTSSVNELEIDGAVSLSPNPTSGLMRIDFDINSFENFQYFIFSQEGKLIQKDKVDVPFKTSLEVDLETYPSGTYYFVLQKENAWKTWKISKI